LSNENEKDFTVDTHFSFVNPLPDFSFLENVDLSDLRLVFACFQANTLYQNAKILATEKKQRLTITYNHDEATLRMWLNGKMMYKAQLFKERFDALI
jgi:hypothetical protein